MTLPRTLTGWLLLGLLGGALAQGCGASAGPRTPSVHGSGAGSAGKDGSTMTVEPPGASGTGGESQYDPLCGITSTDACVPDEETNAMCVDVGTGSGASAGTGGTNSSGKGAAPNGTAGTGGSGTGTGGTSSTPPTAGTGGTESASGAGGEGGVQRSEGGAPQGTQGGGVGLAEGGASLANAGEAGVSSSEGGAGQAGLGAAAGTEAGMGPSMGAFGGRLASSGGTSAGTSSQVTPPSGVSCQVTEDPKHKGSPLAVCLPAGAGTDGAPCFSGADCAPSLACVGDGPGQCRAYCCDGSSCSAHAGTHCAVEPLVLATKSSRVLDVPVCMPSVKCSLAEPYPCPGNNCSCPSDSACVLVGNDATSCVSVQELPPDGEGGDGMACPCAWGYVCSTGTNTCVELCEVAAADTSCPSGRCQSSPVLPAGWGTCVGAAAKDAGAP